jgi:peptide/nickel transport system substrate-binding protein
MPALLARHKRHHVGVVITGERAFEPDNVQRNVILNRSAPPFDKPELRRAMALSVDRKAFIDTLTQGAGQVGGALLAPPEGIWGMPEDLMRQLPGYDPDVAKNRDEARAIMAKLGYGPSKRLKLKVSARDIPPYRDPAVLLIDQLKDIYIDAELELIETSVWYPKVIRKDFTIGLNLTGNGIDDPDQTLFENYACGSASNYDGYCNRDLDKLFEQQSMEADEEKRKAIVFEIDRRLAEDVPRKGYTPMINSIYNNHRMEDVWLDE